MREDCPVIKSCRDLRSFSNSINARHELHSQAATCVKCWTADRAPTSDFMTENIHKYLSFVFYVTVNGTTVKLVVIQTWQMIIKREHVARSWKRWDRRLRCGIFNYISVLDEEVTMETEIRTIRNPRMRARCLPVKIRQVGWSTQVNTGEASLPLSA